MRISDKATVQSPKDIPSAQRSGKNHDIEPVEEPSEYEEFIYEEINVISFRRSLKRLNDHYKMRDDEAS